MWESFAGGTTLITGASAGIGAEFARQLAAGKRDLILVARRQEKLEALAEELRAKHGVQVECLAADLATETGLAKVCEAVASDTVVGLVNNAGHGKLGAFAECPLEQASGQMDLNVKASMHLAHAAARAFTKRRHGVIVNLASVAAFYPVPYFGIYGLTKAFMKNFSLVLSEELRGTGVRSVAVCPGFTKTEFFSQAGMSGTTLSERMAMPVETCVRLALRAIDNKKDLVVTGIQNQILAFLARLLSHNLQLKIGKVIAQKGMMEG